MEYGAIELSALTCCTNPLHSVGHQEQKTSKYQSGLIAKVLVPYGAPLIPFKKPQSALVMRRKGTLRSKLIEQPLVLEIFNEKNCSTRNEGARLWRSLIVPAIDISD